jgi:hypothetical protein
MYPRSRAADIFFTLTFALTFYCVGASFVESFVNYRTWALIGPAEFQAYHQALTPRILGTLVVPLVIQTIMSAGLFWFRPSPVPTSSISIAVAFNVIIWTTTLAIQIPIQRQLFTDGYSLELVNKLITTDWIRKVFLISDALLFLWMMSRLLGQPQFRDPDIPLNAVEK